MWCEKWGGRWCRLMCWVTGVLSDHTDGGHEHSGDGAAAAQTTEERYMALMGPLQFGELLDVIGHDSWGDEKGWKGICKVVWIHTERERERERVCVCVCVCVCVLSLSLSLSLFLFCCCCRHSLFIVVVCYMGWCMCICKDLYMCMYSAVRILLVSNCTI